MRKIILILIALCLMYSATVYADCWYDGKLYPTGSIINGYVCQADGSWKKQ